jgi:hypothetical protein
LKGDLEAMRLWFDKAASASFLDFPLLEVLEWAAESGVAILHSTS